MGATPANRATSRAKQKNRTPVLPLERWSSMAEGSSIVEPGLYSKHGVKRGLRDVNGRGVLAGLTQIGELVAYKTKGDESVPIPGQLIYRGIDINDLVDGFVSEGRRGFEETCYLLLFGELPNKEELEFFGGLEGGNNRGF